MSHHRLFEVVNNYKRLSAAIIIKNGKILLGFRSKHREYFPEVWDLLGGHCEEGESFEDCIRRELKEELGITVLKLKEYQLIDKQPDFLMKLFLIQEWKGTPMNLRPNEHEVVEWFSFQEASKLYFADNQYLEVLQELKRMSILKIFTANKSFLIYKLL